MRKKTEFASIRRLFGGIGVLASGVLLAAAAPAKFTTVAELEAVDSACPSECESASGWSCVLVRDTYPYYDWHTGCKPKQQQSLSGDCVIGIPDDQE